MANNSESLKIVKDCLQNKKGLRLQMAKMAQISTNTSDDQDSSEVNFDSKFASLYSYKYNSYMTDHYVYSALEALCYACGCFTWSDIGMLIVVYH